jgi:hypothetical protein
MKYFYVILVGILISGCSKAPHIEFSGSTPGIDNGLISVKDIDGPVVFKTNIQSGKFQQEQKFDALAGYYILTVAKNGIGTVGAFDIYLESGSYNITTNHDKPFKYPDIRSTSKKANDLAAYYHVSDSVSNELIKKETQLTTQINSPQNKLQTPAAKADLIKQLEDAKAQESSLVLTGLGVFVAKYPDNEIASHIMSNMNYQVDAASCYKVYQKFSQADKNSPGGQQLERWLKYYMAKPLGK